MDTVPLSNKGNKRERGRGVGVKFENEATLNATNTQNTVCCHTVGTNLFRH